jgi:hypothetical protein
VFSWLLTSRETTNFTYELTERSVSDLADLISAITGTPREAALAYLNEPLNDAVLLSHVRETVLCSSSRFKSDLTPRFGRRLGWYLLARILKPKVIVETGVDKGLGSVLLCSALARNLREGFPGYYYGTDINPRAGFLLSGEYSAFGKILYGDSIASLRALSGDVDLFINDSDHSAQYEYEEYKTIAPKLASSAVILGDNSHGSDSLRHFARESGRQFLFFSERPSNHWYLGGGIGIAFFPASTHGMMRLSI